jgi:hypothetical protein
LAYIVWGYLFFDVRIRITGMIQEVVYGIQFKDMVANPVHGGGTTRLVGRGGIWCRVCQDIATHKARRSCMTTSSTRFRPHIGGTLTVQVIDHVDTIKTPAKISVVYFKVSSTAAA